MRKIGTPMFLFEEHYPSSDEEDQTERVTNPVLQQVNVLAHLHDQAPRTITRPEQTKNGILEPGTGRRSDMLTTSDGYF